MTPVWEFSGKYLLFWGNILDISIRIKVFFLSNANFLLIRNLIVILKRLLKKSEIRFLSFSRKSLNFTYYCSRPEWDGISVGWLSFAKFLSVNGLPALINLNFYPYSAGEYITISAIKWGFKELFCPCEVVSSFLGSWVDWKEKRYYKGEITKRANYLIRDISWYGQCNENTLASWIE